MDHFEYRQSVLYCEDVAITALAERYGTPLYVYSRATLERHWHAFDSALAGHAHLVCYAVKANSNLAVLNLLARLGSGFDIVSGGELQRVLQAGGKPSKTVFSGVGKQANEIETALEVGILCFNVESEQELDRIDEIAGRMGRTARISFRVNPDVDARTHPYISTGLKENKFGIAFADAEAVYLKAARLDNIEVVGMDCHIGSQLTEMSPYVDALDRLLALIERLREQGMDIHHLDLGGGLGIRYRDEQPPLPAEWASVLQDRLSGFDGTILIEPGRAIAGNAGILVSRVNYLKHGPDKNFAVIDAAMNDLIRPSLYGAWQEIIRVEQASDAPQKLYDVVGAICESSDFLGKDRNLSLRQNDLLAIRSSGAYGFGMASNYNSRTRAAEVIVDGDRHYCVRERERFEDLIRGESLLP
ncbi:MAG: diaminopimelate decarboxylase [Gammaproteobacteria bacterium]|nr:diaminopimelate decarboxylase [Gammaproteobacteria bacterium]MDH3447012.1 diaminopimelate decarboxylase [Gammaproteobacteria bacterium]